MPVTNYIWHGDNILMEKDETGQTTADYSYNPGPFGELISQRRWDGSGWQTRIHHYDALGSTRALTDETGAETDSYTYDAWGNEIALTSTFENPFRWVGKFGYYWDAELGSHYVRARTYQAAIGRWLSRDPVEYIVDANFYSYVQNRTTVSSDPLGAFPVFPDISSLGSKDSITRVPLLYFPTKLEIEKFVPIREFGCGTYNYSVEWFLSNYHGQKGFIIQNISRVQMIFDCDGKPIKSERFIPEAESWYYEAWLVKNGEIGAINPATRRFQIASMDTFINVGTSLRFTTGIFQICGYAKFFPNYRLTIPPWNPRGTLDYPSADLPNLPGNASIPGFDVGPDNFHDVGGVWHCLQASWDCCCCEEKGTDVNVIDPDSEESIPKPRKSERPCQLAN